MELDSNFDFLNNGAIKIKGTRVGIEIVLDDYLDGHSPEEIAIRYPSLTLKQVYAAITYYLYNKEKMDSYLEIWRQEFDEAWQQQHSNPSPRIKRLLEIKAKDEAVKETVFRNLNTEARRTQRG